MIWEFTENIPRENHGSLGGKNDYTVLSFFVLLNNKS